MATNNKHIPMGPRRPAPEEKAATTHNPSDDHGVMVTPYREVRPEAGWLHCPENTGQYDGDNRPWRR